MIKSNRSEQSRYYGNFRGVDFSSDHTLVSEKRFPYLVNMYKDYVSGGGQGIETIPGFRKRFVATNGGKINGIHSYKDKDSKRHVLVHAGTSLYDWKSFPNNVGFTKEVTAVVKDYDEYTSSIDGIGIAVDFVKVDVSYSVVRGDKIVDVRAIRKVGSQKWISIYPDAIFTGEPTETLFLSNAYTFSQPVENGNGEYTFSIRFPKVIKDSSGNQIEQFRLGDSIEAYCYLISKEDNDDSFTDASTIAQDIKLTEHGTTANGERIISLYTNTSSSSSGKILLWYGSEENQLSRFAKNVLPSGLTSVPFNPTQIASIEWDNEYKTKFPPITSAGDYYRVYMLYDGAEELSDINLANSSFYQYDLEGNKVYLPKDLSRGVSRKTISYSDLSVSGAMTFTVVDVNEYEEQNKSDYVAVDIPDEDGLVIISIRKNTKGEINYITDYRIVEDESKILFKKGSINIGDEVVLKFGAAGAEDESAVMHEAMNDSESKSFAFNNKLYIIDGKNYLVYDGNEIKSVTQDAYIPTTYIKIVPGGENADNGVEYEQRNMLSPYFKHTYIADGVTKEYYLNENEIKGISEIKAYGAVVDKDAYEVDTTNGKIRFITAPKKPEDVDMEGGGKYPEFYAGIEITAIKGVYSAIDEEITNEDFVSKIDSATICTVFDNRVFLSGFKGRPNLIVWCGRNTTGYSDPTYFGVLNYVQDGVGTTPITAMLPLANNLLVLKGDTEQDGAVYYHTPYDTGIDVMPKTYPSETGLAGIGCLGAACNFLDDPVFVSRLGLEAISQLKIASERSKEHRSSLIDAKLVNLSNLKDAKLCEWSGYLALLVDGKMFLADSRQVYQNDRGEMEYEWYYLEDIGIYKDQYPLSKYLTEWPDLFRDHDGNRLPLKISYEGKEYDVQIITDVEAFNEDPPTEVDKSFDRKTGKVTIDMSVGSDKKETTYEYDVAIYKVDGTPKYAFLCHGTGEMIGGEFCPAITIKSIDDKGKENLFFGTESGEVCSFNFDKREPDGTIKPEDYTFDGRTIYSGCALKMDNCGIPHMTKTTVKKSTVIKVKSFQSTAAKLRVRTNSNPYNEIARINATRFDFSNLDFSDFSFVVGEDTLFSVREKEKKWVEKQYYIYSDEYKKPFALFYAAFKYFVAGEFKKQTASVVSTTPSRAPSSSGGGYVGKSPYIEDGYWFVNGVNTFVKAEGKDGATPYVMDGYWHIDGVNLGVKAQGNDGKSVTVTSVTESTEDGGDNIVQFSDGSVLVVKNGKGGTLTEENLAEIKEYINDIFLGGEW